MCWSSIQCIFWHQNYIVYQKCCTQRWCAGKMGKINACASLLCIICIGHWQTSFVPFFSKNQWQFFLRTTINEMVDQKFGNFYFLFSSHCVWPIEMQLSHTGGVLLQIYFQFYNNSITNDNKSNRIRIDFITFFRIKPSILCVWIFEFHNRTIYIE